MTDYLPPVVAKLTGDISGLKRSLNEGRVEVRKYAADIDKIKAVVKIDADMTRLDAKLREIRDRHITAKVKLDLAAGEGARIRRLVEEPPARLKVKLDLVTGAKAAIAAKIQDGEVPVTVKPKIDQLAQRRVATILMELGKRIDVFVRPTVHADDALRTQRRLDRLARDRTATIRTRVIGGGPSASAVGRDASGALKTAISLAPALVPVAASLTASALSLAAAWGSAAVGIGTFGAAVIPQVMMFKTLSDAQTKAATATKKYGAGSQEAAKAQQAVADTINAMPAATQRAAMGFLTLKGDFKAWSNDLARFTMAPVERSFAVIDAILPKLKPLVKGTSAELDRLVTVAGGAVASPGFDLMMKRFDTFTNKVLKHGVDDVIHFSRVLSEGQANGPVAAFMKYAAQQGPAVRQTLKDIAAAAANIVKGASEAGPGMLKLVDAAAKLVAALPPRVIATAMGLYTALRLVGLSSRGITSAGSAVGGLTTRLIAMRTASTAAGGGIAGVRAALATLSTGTKVAGALAVVAGVVLLMQQLSSNGKKAPDVDRMTTAVGNFARTGKASGEMTRVFGTDMDGLGKAIDRVSGKRSGMDAFNDTMNKIFTLGMKESNSKRDAKSEIDAIDKSLAALVSSGHADLAAAAIKEFAKSGDKLPKKKLDDYNSALADAAFQAKLVAQSQGLFGDQAQAVQKKLDAQKQAAQGLQQAILDLNDANRAGLDAEADYQQAIDDATKGIKHHEKALKLVNGVLDLNAQGSRDAYGRMSKLAAATEALSIQTLQQTGSQDKANRVLIAGNAQLVKFGERMGLGTQDAQKFANTLDNIRDPKIQVTANITNAQARANAIKDRINQLSKMKATPQVRADLGRSQSELAAIKQQIAALTNRSYFITLKVGTAGMPADVKNMYGFATGAMVSGGVRRMAQGGMGRPAMMAKGGTNILWGEGPDESYIPHTRTPRSRRIASETVGILGGHVSWGSAGSGSPAGAAAPMGAQVAKGLWAGMSGQAAWLASQARKFALQTIPEPMADALGIKSPSKVAAALGRWVGHGLVQGLTGSTASVKSATLRLSRSIEQVFHDDAKAQLAADQKRLKNLAGVKGKSAARSRSDLRADIRRQQHILGAGSSISRLVAQDNSKLLALAKQRDGVAGKLSAAQKKLTDLQKSWADEKSSISSSIMQGASVVTTSPQEGFALTSQDVVNNMRAQAAKATQFAAMLQALRKKGLRGDLIEQIASSGVDQGSATAAALAGASQGTIAQINSMQKNMKTAADATGSAVANAMYGAGIQSAKGLVKGLQSQEAAIEKQMLKIALAMQKAIRKALGIKSPSTVMARLGDYTAQGMAVGINRSTKHATIAAQGLAMAVQQGASITGGLGAGGGVVNNYSPTIIVQGSVVTERKLIDAVTTGMQQVASRNPNTYPTYRR